MRPVQRRALRACKHALQFCCHKAFFLSCCTTKRSLQITLVVGGYRSDQYCKIAYSKNFILRCANCARYIWEKIRAHAAVLNTVSKKMQLHCRQIHHSFYAANEHSVFEAASVSALIAFCLHPRSWDWAFCYLRCSSTLSIPRLMRYAFIMLFVFSLFHLSAGSASSLCLDAVASFLEHTRNEQQQLGVSETELQLASLSFCKAVRTVPNGKFKVCGSTPRWLWASDVAYPDPEFEVGRTSRVPRLRPLCVAWDLPAKELGRVAFVGIQVLVFSNNFHDSVEGVAWPSRLRSVTFGDAFNQPVQEVSWPESLKELNFGDRFNQEIDGVSWPQSLEQLSFGKHFDKEIDGVEWPKSLHTLALGVCLDQEIYRELWPRSRGEHWDLGGRFNQPINGLVWRKPLQTLIFGYRFNQPISGVSWPESLQHLTFGRCFNQPIDGVSWPASLQQLEFGDQFNKPIDNVEWPGSLERLTFGDCFDQEIEAMSWPESLQTLTFGVCFNQSIRRVKWPGSLEHLRFGRCFNQPVNGIAWPRSLKTVVFGAGFKQPINWMWWPVWLEGTIEKLTHNGIQAIVF